jgi:hypothetical protein
LAVAAYAGLFEDDLDAVAKRPNIAIRNAQYFVPAVFMQMAFSRLAVNDDRSRQPV